MFSEERWRSEAIQVGGIRSARGGLGFWFDRYVTQLCFAQGNACQHTNRLRSEYDDTRSVGPTAFWKMSDEVNVEEE